MAIGLCGGTSGAVCFDQSRVTLNFSENSRSTSGNTSAEDVELRIQLQEVLRGFFLPVIFGKQEGALTRLVRCVQQRRVFRQNRPNAIQITTLHLLLKRPHIRHNQAAGRNT